MMTTLLSFIRFYCKENLSKFLFKLKRNTDSSLLTRHSKYSSRYLIMIGDSFNCLFESHKDHLNCNIRFSEHDW